MKSLANVRAGAILQGKFKKLICVLLSVALIWSFSDIPLLAVADDGGQSTTVNLNDYVTVTLSSDKTSYTAGETATFTITVTNASTEKEFQKVTAANIAFADPALNDAVKGQLPDSITIGKDGKVEKAKKDKNTGTVTPSTATQTFQVTIPADLLTVNTSLSLTVSAQQDKSVSSGVVSIPVNVKASKEGVVVASAADAGTQLNGYNAAYDQDLLKVTFGLLNYNTDATNYDYSLSVVGRKVSGGNGVDITDQLTAQWNDALPGDSAAGMSGLGSIAGSIAGAGTVSFAFDPTCELAKYNEFEVTLTVTDSNGNESSESVALERPHVDLDNFTWAFRDDTANGGYINKTGTAWFSNLYYDNVAADPRVPFSDAASLTAYLCSLKTEQEVRDALEKYIWDMLEPHVGVAGDYGDSSLGWPKDGTTPFHHQIKSDIKQMGSYSQAESGVTYTDDYFQNLKKTAGPDEGDNNTDRDYTIELQAETNPVATKPAVYILMIPTHWQTFDESHATAQKDASKATANGGILTSVDEMANLYDVKNAIRRLATYLKEQGSNAAIAIVNTQHGGDYSMISGGYYTTNMDDLIYGIDGWDSFGDCEHIHWSCNSMQAAIGQITKDLQGWTDAEDEPVDLNSVTKTVVAIGGATENATGDNGYQACLDNTTNWDKDYDPSKDKTAWDNIDYLYGIRTVTGTTQVYQDGRPLYSWLDNKHNQSIIKGKNKYYTSIDDPDNPAYSVCTSEDAVYNKLVGIYEQSRTVTDTSEYGVIDNATISDIVTDEFDVKGVTATWTSCDGTTTTSTWTVDGGTVPGPSDSSADQISVSVNVDGSTNVSVNFGTLTGTGTIDVKIDAVAKQDYMGSNNVDTNVGTPKVNWSHTKATSQATTSYNASFAEQPSVNVPVLDMAATGGADSGRVGTAFNLRDYAEFDSRELLDGRYDQLDGTLTLSWVEVDANGNEIEVADDSSYEPVTYTVADGAIQGTFELPSCTVKLDVVGARSFKLKVSYVPEDAVNGMVPVTGKSVEAKVDLTWTDKMALSVLKVDADDQAPLAGVGFELRSDDGDGAFDVDTDKLAAVYSDAACTQMITGSVFTADTGKILFYGMTSGTYWLKETSTAAGYQLNGAAIKLRVDGNRVYVTGEGGTEAEVTVENDVAHITIENKKIPDLPLSGMDGISLLALIGSVFVLIGLSLSVRRFRLKGGRS